MGDIYHTDPEIETIEDLSGKRTFASLPWWLYALILVIVYTAWSVYTRENLREAFDFIIQGIGTTISAAILSYLIAIVLGLIAGLGRMSKNIIFNNIATFYVEFIRGIPMLVLIFFIGLVGVPTAISWLNELGFTLITNKDISTYSRAIAALSITYGAFLAEIFRAGIQSIGKGQMEAARSQGMSFGQTMRYVILPQAIRNVLPALGNDFVAMVKDSSLVSLLAVGDITYEAKLYSGSSFRFKEAYTILTILYLMMTVALSSLLRVFERRLRND
ncbi:MAG: amino acid ABC transporter permease [Chloroflexi bacterium]|nr:amino acid ABC transporter permease [Chloroflexota bacterium]MBT3671201.1 amino acid ABC transporter permease [Chloroflexota bacterium]MBT4003563.1 amino acid ABC transporter permease [Chloroflexota bacterium]MBT4304340.1 amino acid ABC transporter permease [Chloroflexota bacterium]MBT4534359.1 amino acid ABC transporter permease [Chloroflexota bacterium]